MDPDLWQESLEEAKRELRSSFWGGVSENLSSYYQDGQFENAVNLAVRIYNEKIAANR
jgi:hypothetical protein